MHMHKCTIVAQDAYVQTYVSKHVWGQGSNYYTSETLYQWPYSGEDEKRETSDEGQSVSVFFFIAKSLWCK